MFVFRWCEAKNLVTLALPDLFFLLIFNVLTSYPLNFNFSRKIKSLFTFSVLTSFFINFSFSRQIKSLFVFNVLTSFFITFNFSLQIKSEKFVCSQRFEEFFKIVFGISGKKKHVWTSRFPFAETNDDTISKRRQMDAFRPKIHISTPETFTKEIENQTINVPDHDLRTQQLDELDMLFPSKISRSLRLHWLCG